MSAQAPEELGKRALQTKDYNTAIELFTQAIALNPNNPTSFSYRSAAYAAQSRWADALTDAEHCLAVNPLGWDGYACKGEALHGAGRYSEAIAAYEEGLTLGNNTAFQTAVLREGLKQAQNAKDFATSGENSWYTHLRPTPARETIHNPPWPTTPGKPAFTIFTASPDPPTAPHNFPTSSAPHGDGTPEPSHRC
ncbi:hypothetical protein K438DRAFT_1966920 [Mycena galopus ATCC 62051]|nr:hypothetical protein K438DRAFT_1966920 [Mycena galopus ATCC 62051]